MNQQVFISHSSSDLAAAEAVAIGLKGAGFAVWFDKWDISAGTDFQLQIENAIQASAAAIIMIGEDGLGRWVQPEFRACMVESRERFMPIIPVRLPGAPALREASLFLATFSAIQVNTAIGEREIGEIIRAVQKGNVDQTLGEVSAVLRKASRRRPTVEDEKQKAILDAWAVSTVRRRAATLSETVALEAMAEAAISSGDFPNDVFLRRLPARFALEWKHGYAAALRIALSAACYQPRLLT